MTLAEPVVRPEAPARITVGVVKYASCDGCQLSLLDLEDELLDVAGTFDFVEFPEATSIRSKGPFDVLFVEGSISTEDQLREIIELREQTGTLVTIGTCASAGGIQALRNWLDHDTVRAAVYPNPAYIESLATATPVREHVTVDVELNGCPISLTQLRELLVAVATGRRPQIRPEAVCLECKRRGNVCVLVAAGTACLGPVTQTGCGALCPTFGRGCYGCFGPKESANPLSLAGRLGETREPAEVGRLFAGAAAYAEPFRSIVTALGGTRMDPPGPAAPRPSEGAPD